MKKICCFTGHRPQKLTFGFNEDDEHCIKLKQIIMEQTELLITQYGVTHFIVGMALGIDIYSAEIVLLLKEKYPRITLECAIPCETQCKKWNKTMRNRYSDIVNKCDKRTILQKHYTKDCMQKRNWYMVDKSDYVIAVWNGRPSGTGNTVHYAKSKGKTLIIIQP